MCVNISSAIHFMSFSYVNHLLSAIQQWTNHHEPYIAITTFAYIRTVKGFEFCCLLVTSCEKKWKVSLSICWWYDL